MEDCADHLDIPVRSLPVYHKAKFWLSDEAHHHLIADEYDVVHVHPSRKDKRGKGVPTRFDTVLVNDGAGGYMGVTDKSVSWLVITI